MFTSVVKILQLAGHLWLSTLSWVTFAVFSKHNINTLKILILWFKNPLWRFAKPFFMEWSAVNKGSHFWCLLPTAIRLVSWPWPPLFSSSIAFILPLQTNFAPLVYTYNQYSYYSLYYLKILTSLSPCSMPCITTNRNIWWNDNISIAKY